MDFGGGNPLIFLTRSAHMLITLLLFPSCFWWPPFSDLVNIEACLSYWIYDFHFDHLPCSVFVNYFQKWFPRVLSIGYGPGEEKNHNVGLQLILVLSSNFIVGANRVEAKQGTRNQTPSSSSVATNQGGYELDNCQSEYYYH